MSDDKKSFENIFIYYLRYKSTYRAKPLHIMFHRIN